MDCAPVSALWCRGSSLRRALGDTPSWGPRSGPSVYPWLGPSQEGPFRAGSGLPDGELREAGPAGGGQWAGFPPAARFLPPAPWGDRAAGSACGSTEQPPWGPCGHGLPAPGRLRALAVCREGGLSVPFRRDSEPAPSLAVQQTGRGACAGLGPPPGPPCSPRCQRRSLFTCRRPRGRAGSGAAAPGTPRWPPVSLGAGGRSVQGARTNRRAALGATCPRTCFISSFEINVLLSGNQSAGLCPVRALPEPLLQGTGHSLILPPLPCPRPFPVAVWREAFSEAHPQLPSCPL